jgi:hypothetical protein
MDSSLTRCAVALVAGLVLSVSVAVPMAAQSASDTLWLGTDTSNTLNVVNVTKTGTVIRSFGPRQATGLAILGGNIWASTRNTSAIDSYNLNTLAGPGTLSFTQHPATLGEDMASDGTFLYRADPSLNRVWKVDPTTGAATTFIIDGGGPMGVAYTGTFFYVSLFNTGKIRQFDLAGAPTGVDFSIAAPGPIGGLAWDVCTGTLWVSSGTTGVNHVYNVNVTTGAILSSFASPDGRFVDGLEYQGGGCPTQGGTGAIIIRKNTIGDDGTFGYTGSLGSFSITTSSLTGTQLFSNIPPGGKTVIESPLPPGWAFTSLVCSDPDGGTTVTGQTANIDLDPGETVVCTYTNTKCLSPPSGMVAWWPFDETGGLVVHDTAHGNNGTPKTGPIGSGGPTPGSGMVAGALNFNGTSDFVQVANATNLNFGTGSLSIDAWVKILAPGTGFMPIVDKQIAGPTDAPYGYVFYVKDGHLGFAMNNDINVTPHAGIGAEDTTRNLADSNWHHVAVTVQRNLASATGGNLFIDGMAIVTATFSTIPFISLTADNTGDVILGSTNRLGRLPVSAFFNGWIDEVEIFNRALGPQDVLDLFDAGSAGKCKPTCVQPPAGMEAWYPLDEGTGALSVTDISGNGHNGTPGGLAVGFVGGPIPGAPNSPPAVVGGFLYFQDLSSRVSVPDNPPLSLDIGSGDFTIDAWVVTNGAVPGLIVDKLDAAAHTGYRLYLAGGALNFSYGDGTSLPLQTAQSTPSIPTHQWHHVAVTIERGTAMPFLTVSFYVDGAAAGSQPLNVPVGIIANTLDLFIGGIHTTNMGPTEIGIDELELFHSALGLQDIKGIFDAGSAGKCKPTCVQPPAGMVAWWTFDETTGSTIIHDIWTQHLDGAPVPAPVGPGGPSSLLGEHVRNSLYFVTTYVDVPFSAPFNFFNGGTGEFSIDAWVKSGGAVKGPLPNVIHPVVDKTVVVGSGVKGYALYLYAPTFQAPHLAFTLDDGMPVAPPPTLLDSAPLPTGWHHVAVTVARSSSLSAAVTLYVDGMPSPTAAVAVGDTDNNADLWIGKSRVGSPLLASDATEFALDEVEIFNRVLTPQDIEGIYHADSLGKCRTSGSRPARPPARYLPFR